MDGPGGPPEFLQKSFALYAVNLIFFRLHITTNISQSWSSIHQHRDWGSAVNHTRLAVLFCVIVVSASSFSAQNNPQEHQNPGISPEGSAKTEALRVTKTAVRKQRADESSTDACNITFFVEERKKLGGFVLKQMETELNRIMRTGGANIHVRMITEGRADYVLRVQNVAPKNNLEGDILGQTSKQDPRRSSLFVDAIENVWRERGALPRGGRGIVYARVYAHELAAHGILGWAHSQPGDKDMGFIGSGSNWSDFLFNNEDDSKFEFSAASGRQLNLRCRSRNDAQRPDPLTSTDKSGPRITLTRLLRPGRELSSHAAEPHRC